MDEEGMQPSWTLYGQQEMYISILKKESRNKA